jgi:hypothetical protein
LEMAAPFIQLDPRASQNFNADKIVRFVGSIFNAPQEMYRETDEVEQIREQEAQAQQAAMEAQEEMQTNQVAAAVAAQATGQG